MTAKDAFEVSAGWAFIELAKKIGKDNYKTKPDKFLSKDVYFCQIYFQEYAKSG
jgi:beta-lactamase class D